GLRSPPIHDPAVGCQWDVAAEQVRSQGRAYAISSNQGIDGHLPLRITACLQYLDVQPPVRPTLTSNDPTASYQSLFPKAFSHRIHKNLLELSAMNGILGPVISRTDPAGFGPYLSSLGVVVGKLGGAHRDSVQRLGQA